MFKAVKALLKPCLDSASPVYVAFSGGLDSTVLLHLVQRITPKITAIHVNHNLSPNAPAWQAHCETICQNLQVKFIAKSVYITDKTGGLEAQARKMRYQAIAEVIEANAVVLTGQHQDDQIETFLLQLKRGAGPKGLSSMPQSAEFEKDACLLRPLLSFSRSELEEYARQFNLSWIEDESNLDTRFDRNFIRHQITPLLNERWQGFSTAACRSISLVAEQQQLVDELAELDLQKLKITANQISITELLSLSNIRQRNVVRFWIHQQGVSLPSQIMLQRIFDEVVAAKKDADPVVQWSGYQVRRYRDALYLLNESETEAGEDLVVNLNQTIVFNHGIGELLLSDNQAENGMAIPAPKDNDLIQVRFNVKGLVIKPQGSKHTRKLKDLYKDNGIPPWQRARVPLLFYGEQLIAVAGVAAIEQGDETVRLRFKTYRNC